MCWNSAISLNTFIFSAATLAFIAYNNAYTKYKIPEFVQNPWLYVFFLSTLSMQLVEYFIWTDNATIVNQISSIVGSLLLIVQPVFLSLSISNASIGRLLAISYSVFAVLFVLAKYPGNLSKFSTKKTEDGLQWDWYDNYEYQWLHYVSYWVVTLICAFYLPTYLAVAIFGIVAVAIARWWNTQRFLWGSKYCWGFNALSFYYLYRIMISMPLSDSLFRC
jgi:hypothetical protein